MPSKSKTQQRLFGWALACKTGESKDCPANVQKLADSMTIEELEKYASTSHDKLPDAVEESVFECIEEMTTETMDILEKETTKETNAIELKPSDVPPISKDIKNPITDITPEPPPGYVHADKRKDPGFFTPSLFKRPGDKKIKSERRLMDFPEFLTRINYKTHDDTLQKGHGQNVTGNP